MAVNEQAVRNYSGHELSMYTNIRVEGGYVVGDKKPEFVLQPGALYQSGSVFFAHPGHSIDSTLSGAVQVVAILESHEAANFAANMLNQVRACTPEQLACEDAGKIGRTSPVGLAPRAYNCPKCGVALVPAFGAMMRHPSTEDVPRAVRHLL